MQIIPIQDVASQTLNIMLGGQSCTVNLYCKDAYGTFIDLLVNETPVVVGVICQNQNRIVRDGHLGFIGDIGFLDLQGTADPVSPGLGSRFALCYLTAADVALLA